MWRDVERICADLGLPFRRPDPFPQSGLLAARVALVGLTEGWGADFIRAVYRAEFAEGRQIGDRAVIADLLKPEGSRSGAGAGARPIGRHQVAAAGRDRGSATPRPFGAPSFTTADGELFWGNDRLGPPSPGRRVNEA